MLPNNKCKKISTNLYDKSQHKSSNMNKYQQLLTNINKYA